MKDKYFLDTNIFVYTFDFSSPIKQQRAQDFVRAALADNLGIISYQVVQEFLNVATRKSLASMTMPDIKIYLNEVLLPLCEFYPNSGFYEFSLDIKEQTKFSFYDSMIIAAAIKMGCKTLYSEDLSHNQSIMGLNIKNPFAHVH
jgi:predicted nucleic acid-binding protein